MCCVCGIWEDSWEDKQRSGNGRKTEAEKMERWTDRRIRQSWSRMQSNAAELIQSPLFPSSIETDRRIDRLSVCVGALLSAHSSINSGPPGSSVYWWLEKDERYEAEESVSYSNQFLTGEWTWRILAGRHMECVCLLPWGPEFTMWVLLHRQLRLLQQLHKCYKIRTTSGCVHTWR